MAIDRDQTVRIRTEQLQWRRIENEIIVLDLRRNTYLSISATGIDLWESLATGSTPAELESHLATTYGIGSDRAGADVDAFLDRIGEAGLLA